MILKDNLYSIASQSTAGNRADFRVALNADNFIYKAHFPDNPITPGVCLIQMAVELYAAAAGGSYRIGMLKNVKFTAPISPLEFAQIDVGIEFEGNRIKAVIKEKDMVFAKMSLTLYENLRNNTCL
jgi:3-hydroxyacyl-[acyl-carrier-protein] dehydratase